MVRLAMEGLATATIIIIVLLYLWYCLDCWLCRRRGHIPIRQGQGHACARCGHNITFTGWRAK